MLQVPNPILGRVRRCADCPIGRVEVEGMDSYFMFQLYTRKIPLVRFRRLGLAIVKQSVKAQGVMVETRNLSEGGFIVFGFSSFPFDSCVADFDFRK